MTPGGRVQARRDDTHHRVHARGDDARWGLRVRDVQAGPSPRQRAGLGPDMSHGPSASGQLGQAPIPSSPAATAFPGEGRARSWAAPWPRADGPARCSGGRRAPEPARRSRTCLAFIRHHLPLTRGGVGAGPVPLASRGAPGLDLAHTAPARLRDEANVRPAAAWPQSWGDGQSARLTAGPQGGRVEKASPVYRGSHGVPWR